LELPRVQGSISIDARWSFGRVLALAGVSAQKYDIQLHNKLDCRSWAFDDITIAGIDILTMPSAKDTSADDSPPLPSFYEPLAIVGLACRLPGNINSPSQFWELLKQGKDARGPVPEGRYASTSFDNHLRRTAGPATTPEGYFLGHDIEQFDAECFSMNRTEAAHLDPVQRQLLEITQECLDSAGVNGSSGQKIGCFVGTFGEDWQDLRRKDTLDHGPYRMIGSSDFAASNRISFEYDFRGPRLDLPFLLAS
jgi:hypothetical protein